VKVGGKRKIVDAIPEEPVQGSPTFPLPEAPHPHPKRRKCEAAAASFASNLWTLPIKPRPEDERTRELHKFTLPELFVAVLVIVQPVDEGKTDFVDTYLQDGDGCCFQRDAQIRATATKGVTQHAQLKAHGYRIDLSTDDKTMEVLPDVDSSQESQLSQLSQLSQRTETDQCDDACVCNFVRLSAYPHIFTTKENAKETMRLIDLLRSEPANGAAAAAVVDSDDANQSKQVFYFRVVKPHADAKDRPQPRMEAIPDRKLCCGIDETAKTKQKTKKMSDEEAVRLAVARNERTKQRNAVMEPSDLDVDADVDLDQNID
jgi:hypothetical protein